MPKPKRQLEEESNASASSSEVEKDEESDDADKPRVVQWVDEDELDEDRSDEDSEEQDGDEDEVGDAAEPPNIEDLREGLSGLPLGALRKAQNVLKRYQADSDDGDDASASDDGSDDQHAHAESSKLKADTPREEWSRVPRPGVKRSNKHAPMEVTSKRPVTRRREVVEVKTLQSRDPRFLSVTGEFSPEKFHQQYGFLFDAHKTELSTLRENLKRARKLVLTSPRDLREEREVEVERLERAVKRMESVVNKEKRDKIERETLQKLAEEERKKRKDGKSGWWLKEGDKKEALTRARYEALAAEGGKRAVKRAIDKKQKKLGQKEKKTRPFNAKSSSKGIPVRDSSTGGGQPPPSRPNKRQRVA